MLTQRTQDTGMSDAGIARTTRAQIMHDQRA